jgi:heterodisulfide reductase subunit A-like polyferredoxin
MRAQQMEVAWSKVGAIRMMIGNFPIEIFFSPKACCSCMATCVPVLPKRVSPQLNMGLNEHKTSLLRVTYLQITVVKAQLINSALKD